MYFLMTDAVIGIFIRLCLGFDFIGFLRIVVSKCSQFRMQIPVKGSWLGG